MDTSNLRLTTGQSPVGGIGGGGGAGEPTMDAGDWRTELQPEARQRIVSKIMDKLKRHLPVSGQEGLHELRKIAIRFEENIFTAATSQGDYLRKISLKMLTMETKPQNVIDQQKQLYPRAVPDTSLTSLDSTSQTGNANGGDWQEVYQKIKALKEMYLPELNEIYHKIATKLQQVSKSNILPNCKEKLVVYEKQILNFVNTNRPRKPVSSLQQGQLPPSHMHSMQQPQPQVTQMQPHESQMNPQLQSMSLQGSVATLQQNNMDDDSEDDEFYYHSQDEVLEEADGPPPTSLPDNSTGNYGQ